MPVTYRCANMQCRKILMVPDEMRGKNVRCSYCGTMHLVPRKKVKKQLGQTASSEKSK